MIPLSSSSDPVVTSDHNTTTSTASHGETASVFGIVFTLDPDVGTTAFICFVIGLVVIEYFVEKLETMAEHRGLNSLFQKLQKELMMMGIISFCVFVYETVAHPPAGSILLEAMEMTHIIVLFMALAFIAQAVFIVIYATIAGKKYLSIMRTSSESLVESYRQLENNPRQSWWFHYGSSLLPGTCPLRSRVETRIIERLFVNEHRLPPEFNFAQYISILFEVSACYDDNL
jgi:hypothetical protein